MPAWSDTLVFVPAWNEEENLSAVLDELRRELPQTDVLVLDDGLDRLHGRTERCLTPLLCPRLLVGLLDGVQSNGGYDRSVAATHATRR